jgi:hypothetical protein
MGLSAGSNTLISSTKNVVTNTLLNGENVSAKQMALDFKTDIQTNGPTNAMMGAGGYFVGSSISNFVNASFFPPVNSSQKVITGAMHGIGVAVSNTDFLEFTAKRIRQLLRFDKP